MSSQIINIILIVLGSLASLGLAAGGIGYLYSQFVTGKGSRDKNEIDTENSLIDYLKKQNDGFKTVVKEQDDKINQLGKEIAAMQATLSEKDKTIEKYLGILQNRNPELEQFMLKLAATADHSEAFMQEQREMNLQKNKALSEIAKFMESINRHMETANKELKIEATVSHNGSQK